MTRSDKQDLVHALIKNFEDAYPAKKYKSDWNSFLSESKLEDFLHIDSETVFVSTIHKAKGKEFSNVFIALNHFDGTEDAKRAFYVAATRAKTNLSIHYNGNFLEPGRTAPVRPGLPDLPAGILYKQDNNSYTDADQITLHLTHKDIYLKYFGFVQRRIDQLWAGAPLRLLDDGLANAQGEQVLKYSRSFAEKMEGYFKKGYHIIEAKVNFVVYWKNEEEKEWKIVLAGLVMRR